MVESFWAIPDVGKLRTPATILREQASALTEQTKGTLVGIAEAHPDGGSLRLNLDVSVPSLNSYRYRILTYTQPIELYPGLLSYGRAVTKVGDEAEFEKEMKAILSSVQVKQILTSLLSQAADVAGARDGSDSFDAAVVTDQAHV